MISYSKKQMKAGFLLQKAKKELIGVSSQPYQESLWLLSHSLSKESNDVGLALNTEGIYKSNENEKIQDIYLDKIEITEQQKQDFWNKIQKRKNNYPLQYLLEERYFLNHRFYIQEGVFIPRRETELLVKRVFKKYPQDKALKIMDWGAGAGAISLSLLSYFFRAECLAVDIHLKSLKCLKKNQERFGIKDRVAILKEDISRLKKNNLRQSVDLITANPPYIDPKDKRLHPQVYLFEPPAALFSDQGGMSHIYSWFYRAMEFLTSGGCYIFEFGWNQSQLTGDFLSAESSFISYEILKDSLGYDRAALVIKK